jgi:hypothetical protein
MRQRGSAMSRDVVAVPFLPVWRSDGSEFSDATTALQVDHELWIGSAESHSLAILPLEADASR